MGRRYDSPVRRRQVAETRERIVAAGAQLLHGFPIWNWRALTHRAVAERAGVTERTVYRYFAGERELRDAVMSRMERESGVELEGLTLERVKEVAAQIFDYVATFPIEPRTPPDPTFAAAAERQRAALVRAVQDASSRWPPKSRLMAAAMLDVLWSPVAFEKLIVDWKLSPRDATAAITWTIGLVERALEEGPRPR